MTYEKLARTLDQVLADNVRLKRERDELWVRLKDLTNRCADVAKGNSFSHARIRADLEEPLAAANACLLRINTKG